MRCCRPGTRLAVPMPAGDAGILSPGARMAAPRAALCCSILDTTTSALPRTG